MLTELSASVRSLLYQHIYRICVTAAKDLKRYMLVMYANHASSLGDLGQAISHSGCVPCRHSHLKKPETGPEDKLDLDR